MGRQSPCARRAPTPTRPRMLNLSMLIEHHARLHPDREAIVCGAVRLTYVQLDAAARRVAGALAALGVTAGDHVALSCPNTPHFPIALAATDAEPRVVLRREDAKEPSAG